MRSRALLATLVILGGLSVVAQAATSTDTTIYQDNFAREVYSNGTWGAAPLSGSTCSTDPSGAQWSAHPEVWTNIGGGGGYAAIHVMYDNRIDFAGFLPFVPAYGNVYTLSADILSYPGSHYEAVALGYASSVSGLKSVANNGTAWAVEKIDSSGNVSVGRGVTRNGLGLTYYTNSNPLYQGITQPSVDPYAVHTFNVVLDTRSKYWTMATSVDGNVYASFDYRNANGGPSNPGIDYVGFSSPYWIDSVQNFGLVQSVYLPGDTNSDGSVDGTDLNAVLSNYNQTNMTWAQGDFNHDGTVDGTDLNTVLSNYNTHVSVGAAVPEPSTLLLVAAGIAGLLAYAGRKRK